MTTSYSEDYIQKLSKKSEQKGLDIIEKSEELEAPGFGLELACITSYSSLITAIEELLEKEERKKVIKLAKKLSEELEER